ncbi:tetratricopeptide repeat protein [Corynebacterium phoceense]|nr:tetratricopeptide repeat protein [Corynebacterium phoceense]MCQ9332497.1 tetratricopeptide repeat protein [Corynebacterium phoceense]
MSDSNSYGRRDGDRRGGKPQGKFSGRNGRRDEGRGRSSFGSGRDEDNRRDRRGDVERGYHGDRNERRDDRRGGRNDHRGSGRRDDRRDDRRGDDRRDSRRDDNQRSHSPQRSGFREERINRRQNDPDIPSDIDMNELDPSVLQDLKSLSKDNAEATAKHMIMAAMLMQDDPQLALRHARAAKDRAGRVSVAREINGVAAYHAGEWKEALAELRAARRISGGPGMLAVMADCERGLGRPQKAIELGRSEEAKMLDRDGEIELAIVVAGARLDMGQAEAAVVTIQRARPDKAARGESAARLSYAYANALLEAGRTEEAKEWFKHTVAIDEDEATDAVDRLKEF